MPPVRVDESSQIAAAARMARARASEYDRGPILAQILVPVHSDDTPESLQKRVLEKEHIIYPATIQKIASGEIET